MGTGHGKPPLTQYLGVFPDELTLVPPSGQKRIEAR